METPQGRAGRYLRLLRCGVVPENSFHIYLLRTAGWARAIGPTGLLLAAVLAAAPGAVLADQAGDRLAPGTPDLVLGANAMRPSLQDNTWLVTVTNMGSAPSGKTTVLLVDRPPLVASPTGEPLFPRHRFLRGERGLVIWPERRDDAFLIRVRWQGRAAADTFAGRLRLESSSRLPIEPASLRPRGRTGSGEVTQQQDGWVRWQAATGASESGFDLSFTDPAAPAVLSLQGLTVAGVPNLRQIFVGNWWLTRFLRNQDPEVSRAGRDDETTDGPGPSVTIPLDDPRLFPVSLPSAATSGLWVEEPLPGLDPGGRATVSFSLEEPAQELFAVVDPDNEVMETKEGNNSIVWRQEPSRAMVSLHTHASLSEGTASVDAQMDLLSRSGYDAVFWTEHDWRMAGHDFPAVFDFEAGSVAWEVVPKRLDAGLAAEGEASQTRSTDGSSSLRLQARRTSAGGGPPLEAAFALRAFRGQHIRSLAEELSIAFDLYPDLDNPFDSHFRIDLQLSDQPHARRWMSYRVDVLPDAAPLPQLVLPAPTGADETARITVPPGRWTRLVLPVSEHARQLFPEGIDNNVSTLQFGIAVRRGTSTWFIDRLTMETAITGAALAALQREWTQLYPALSSYVVNEISYYIPHFNQFVEDPFLLDYKTLAIGDYGERARQETWRRNGALSLNHPMGFNQSYPTDVIENQLRTRLFGADLLEVGYRYRGGTDLAGHLEFWDRALAAGIPATGIGVTDAHGAGRGNGFHSDENNMATWVEADPSSLDSLLEGLLAGRLTFGDPLLFDGRLDLDLDGQPAAGAVILSPPQVHQASFEAAGLLPGALVDLLADGETVTTVFAGEDGTASGGASLPPTARSVRVEAWGPDGRPLGFSNAALLLRHLPTEPLPLSRLRIDLERGKLTGNGRFRVQSLEEDETGFRLRGDTGDGVLILAETGGPPHAVHDAGSETEIAFDYDPVADVSRIRLAPPGVDVEWAVGGDDSLLRWWLLGIALLGVGLVFVLVHRRRSRRSFY